MKTFNEAKKAAKARAVHFGQTYYVIKTDDIEGPYTCANDEDLDTYFCSIKDEDILYCTLEEE